MDCQNIKINPLSINNNVIIFDIENNNKKKIFDFKLIIKNNKKIYNFINKCVLEYGKMLYEGYTRGTFSIKMLYNLVLCKFLKKKIKIKKNKIIIPLFYFNKYQLFNKKKLVLHIIFNKNIDINLDEIMIKYKQQTYYNKKTFYYIYHNFFSSYKNVNNINIRNCDDMILLYIKKNKIGIFPKILSFELIINGKTINISKNQIIKNKINNIKIYLIALHTSLKKIKSLIKKNKHIYTIYDENEFKKGIFKINFFPNIYDVKCKFINVVQTKWNLF